MYNWHVLLYVSSDIHLQEVGHRAFEVTKHLPDKSPTSMPSVSLRTEKRGSRMTTREIKTQKKHVKSEMKIMVIA